MKTMKTMNTLNPHPVATTAATPPKSKFLSVKFATVLLMAISPLAVQGAITVTGSDTYGAVPDDTAFSYEVQETDSMLVFGFYNDEATDPTGASFGGVTADGFLAGSRMGIAYWKNPTVGSGDFTFTGISGAHVLLGGVFELANVDLDETPTGTFVPKNTDPNEITTVTANEFVVSFAGRNGDSTITPGVDSIIDSDLFSIGGFVNPPDGTSTTNALGGGTGLAGAAGLQEVTWDNEDRGSLTYSFQAIPEPSSTALIVLGGLALILRRRR